jgi:hypothetical protein
VDELVDDDVDDKKKSKPGLHHSYIIYFSGTQPHRKCITAHDFTDCLFVYTSGY